MRIQFIRWSILALSLLTLAAQAAPTCEQPGGASVIRASAEQGAALRDWSATIARRDTPETARVEALIQRGETYRALGRYPDAEADLLQALAKSRAAGLDSLEVVALQALGQVDAQQRRTTQAEERLDAALERARRLANPTLIAASANALGNLRFEQGAAGEAGRLYREALQAAERVDDPALRATIRINLARQSTGSAQALRELQSARTLANQVPSTAERVELLIGLAHVARRSAPGTQGQTLARESLTTAAELASQAGLDRAESQARGGLSELADERGQTTEARRLAEQAIAAAPIDAYDLRYQWEWRLGRLLRDQGDRRRAIAAYRRAVDHLQHIRNDIPVEYAEGRSSFRETLEPLYLGLADLLLLESASLADAGGTQALLREARDTVEQIKLDELRDYFRDACILPLRQEIETLAPRAAVLYPVILDDRLEILVSIGRRLYQATTPIGREPLTLTAEILALKLRYDQPIDEEATQLHAWLIAPIQSWLDAQSIDTLVFVPDGPLRAVPLSALRGHDHYLVERYAVATVPGLKLLQPDALSRTDMTTLLAGLSRPGPVVDELPGWWVDALIEQHRGRGRGALADANNRRGVSVGVRGVRGETRRSGPSRAATNEKIDALSLPGVAEEIDQLAQRVPGRALRDQEFLLSRFVEEVGGQPYRVVHIASHGLFQGPPEENFIVTYDRKLDMKTLASALKPKELAQRPIEVLVLSACQTAEGDDRTPLGLSGIAIQSGARSALGSLWPVGDQSTQALMRDFYDQLRQPGMSKARALQAAQKAMIARGGAGRPGDWAAFILVGNWL
jgi:CHAT domain-containing protein